MARTYKRKTKPEPKKSIPAMVDEAAILNFQKKEIEKKLNPLKDKLKEHVTNNYTQEQIQEGFLVEGIDYILKIEGCEEREDADPEEVLDLLTKQKRGEKFFDVIKVLVEDFTALVGEETVKGMRKLLCYSPRQKFIKK